MQDTFGCGFTVSLGRAWDRPHELAELLTLASSLGARATRLDVAADFLGVPAMPLRWRLFPSVDGPLVGHGADALRLRAHGRRRRPTGQRNAWVSFQHTSYLGTRRSGRTLALYCDRPSKLHPDGRPVLHVELRLRGVHLPDELRDPVSLVPLVVPETRDRALAALLAQHTEGALVDHLITRARAHVRWLPHSASPVTRTALGSSPELAAGSSATRLVEHSS